MNWLKKLLKIVDKPNHQVENKAIKKVQWEKYEFKGKNKNLCPFCEGTLVEGPYLNVACIKCFAQFCISLFGNDYVGDADAVRMKWAYGYRQSQ